MELLWKGAVAVFVFLVGYAMLKFHDAPTWGAMVGGWVLVCTLQYWNDD